MRDTSALAEAPPAGPGRFLRCRRLSLELGRRTYVMGVLNVTPDSFSDGGRFLDPGQAIEHAHRMVEAGADVIDIGAESTRPGSDPVPASVELERLLPVLRPLVRAIRIPISVDTVKASVAAQALGEGVDLINDVSGLRCDPQVAVEVARANAGLVVMHMRGSPRTMQDNPVYQDVVREVTEALTTATRQAERAGVGPEAILVDPGIGFGKTVWHNLALLRRLRELTILGKPILVGPSRKSFIGHVLGTPVDDRLEGTAAAVAAAIFGGAAMVRVHDVGPMVRVVRMTDAILGGGTGC